MRNLLLAAAVACDGTIREPCAGVERGSPLFPETRKRHRVYRGLSERQEKYFNWFATGVVLLFVAGWIGAILVTRQQEAAADRAAVLAAARKAPVAAPSPSRQITDAIVSPSGPKAAYLNEAMLAFLNPLRGASGKVRFTTQVPGAPIVKAPGGATAVLSSGSTEVSSSFTAPANPGVYDLAVKLDQATESIKDFSVITLVPFTQKQGGKLGLYYLGTWPFERGGKPKTPAYANPSGFIQVTPQNVDTYVSAHFKLRDFLTKDQPNTWPKYLLLNPKLLDKLELTIQELEAAGHPVQHMTIMSGFRTPNYNYTGGNTQGRANLSRHMYGDASDVFVDNDHNGVEDDLNHDGRVDFKDAQIIADAADRVERKYPSLVGGIGVYVASSGHGPFTHIDVRGYRARWRGTGNG